MGSTRSNHCGRILKSLCKRTSARLRPLFLLFFKILVSFVCLQEILYMCHICLLVFRSIPCLPCSGGNSWVLISTHHPSSWVQQMGCFGQDAILSSSLLTLPASLLSSLLWVMFTAMAGFFYGSSFPRAGSKVILVLLSFPYSSLCASISSSDRDSLQLLISPVASFIALTFLKFVPYS